MLRVSEHLHLLSSQFLARCLQPQHPSHSVVTRPPGRRKMKETLHSKVIQDVQPFLDANGVIAPGTYGDVIKSLHTDAVVNSINNRAPNRVLGDRPPAINTKEKYLQRKTRVTLAQMRSGFCYHLKDYQFRIGKTQDETCPLCLLSPQTVKHVFECPARPTQLIPNDLWSFPVDVASFLSSHPSYDVPPPPPPPPGRRRRGRVAVADCTDFPQGLDHGPRTPCLWGE